MTARAEVVHALSRICARCDGAMVVTRDAIGRERLRCPRCDGVSQIRPHPDEVLVPQGLVRVPASTPLPPIERGQLRCQLCARGVPVTQRFCSACVPAPLPWAPKVCERGGCGAVFLPTGPNAKRCEGCR